MQTHTGRDGYALTDEDAASMASAICAEPTADETTHDLFMENLKKSVDKDVYESFCRKYRAHQKHCRQLMQGRQVVNPSGRLPSKN
ncbi:MAG: hypothetical protein EOM20_07330 [Spartobacteria bacterium]|nr:hypothetical protein [Spartobacteria bacterium]